METEAVKARFPHSRLLVRPLKPWKKKKICEEIFRGATSSPAAPEKTGIACDR